MTTTDEVDGRTRHYSDFYGLTSPGEATRVAVVVGNCQAESLRIMLQGDDVEAVRMPPVHELTARDMPHLDRLLARADTLVSQPVRDDYHGLPVGIAQLAGRLAGSTVVPMPVIRFTGLYPTHAIIRPPRDASIVPPVVEYHDLSTLALAAGDALPALDVGRVRAVGAASLDELRRREEAHRTVLVSDLFASPDFGMMRTMNHPGNSVWTRVALRVRAAAGLAERSHDPGRPLLDAVHAPREAAVVDAWSLDASPIDRWLVDGIEIGVDDVRAAHLDWYRANPDIVAAGLARHAGTLRILAGA